MNVKELHTDIAQAIEKIGFTTFTDIQEQTIPLILQGHDVLGHSATGSGKTAAFGLPILQMIHEHDTGGIQALILTPTRELCVQVTDALVDFAQFTNISVTSVYGGVGYEPQKKALKRSQVVVATPGRLLDHINQNTVDLSRVRFSILDEADKMLEMGFLDDVEKIMTMLRKKRQTLFFSATMPPPIRRLTKKILNNPHEVTSNVFVDKSKLTQVYYDTSSREKFSLLVHLLKKNPQGLSLIFCATRREVDILCANLKEQGVKAIPIHGGLTQNKRLKAIELLKNEQVHILVATDVAARGLDIKNVQFVYNYDVPKSEQDYLHRIGRTARAGEKGAAITLLAHRDHESFEKIYSDSISKVDVPTVPKVFFDRNLKIKDDSRTPQHSQKRRFSRERNTSQRSRRSSSPRRFGESQKRSESRDSSRRSNAGFKEKRQRSSSHKQRRFATARR